MDQQVFCIIVVSVVSSCNAFFGGQGGTGGGGGGGGGGMGGGGGGMGGGLFDSLFQAFSGPTSSPFMDPFSNNFGPGMMRFMMADIDHADRISGMADARAGRQEAMQGQEVRQGQQQPKQTMRSGTKPGARSQLNNYNSNNYNQGADIASMFTQGRPGSTSLGAFSNRQPMQRSLPGQQSMLTSPSGHTGQERKGIALANTQQESPVIKSEAKPKTIAPKQKSFLPHQERNRLRLSHVLKSSKGSQLKDIAVGAISRNDLRSGNTKYNVGNQQRKPRPRRLRDRIPPKRRSRRPMDPDLMSDMMDMAADFGLASMFMGGQNSGRGGRRCNPSSMQNMMEFMMTGRSCGSGGSGMSMLPFALSMIG